MSEPIELIRGSERITVYSTIKASPLEAEGWQRVKNLSPEQQRKLADLPPQPFAGYDDLTAQEVIAKSEGLPPARIAEVVAYESATKGRVGVVDKLTGRQREPAPRTQEATQELPPVTVETVKEGELKTTETVEILPANEAPAPDQDAPANGGIVPQNDAPAAMNQGRLAKRSVPRGTTSE